jgi:hypothetical protein
MVAEANRAEKALKNIEAIRRRTQIQEEIDREDARQTVTRRFGTNNTEFDELEQFAIQEDPGLLRDYEDYLMGIKQLPANFGERVNQIISSPEFKQRFFDNAFSMAMDAFSVLEDQIRLDFELGLNDSKVNDAKVNLGELRDLVEEDEKRIADLQYVIDDLDAGLERMSREEDKINESYDKRFEALDKIQKANDAISRQQKTQLTLADALSRGDISAAARAAQEMRADSASGSIQSQREMLERTRDAQLAGLTTDVNGQKLTRKQIEEAIKKNQEAIFDIEEKTLEVNRQAIANAEFKIAQAVRNLEVAGLTRAEWEKEKNAIDAARISTINYNAVLTAALDLVQSIISDWKSLDGMVVTTKHVIKTERSEDGSDPYDIMANSSLAIANKEYFEKTVLPGVTSGTATAAQIIDYTNAVNQALGRPMDTPVAMAMGGVVKGYAKGGKIPKYMAAGGMFKSLGTDTVPAMLTPGEFVVRKYAVDNFGTDKLKAINSGTYKGDSMYNYEVNVSVQTDANPDQIARAVMGQIKQIDAQRIRGNRF